MNWFESKKISPMLIAQNQPPFDSPDFLFELKWDGIRCLAYLDAETELRNKRNKNLNPIYPELKNIHKQAAGRCILDGELVALKNGKPDFHEVQRRSLMSDPFKIGISAKKQPVIFIAYDVLFAGNEPVIDRPLTSRADILSNIITESPSLTISRQIPRDGIALFEAAKAQGLEGIVAKRKDSLYFPGKRTKDWIKMKNLLDEDFIVCGYYKKEGTVASVIIGSYADGKIMYRGHVALGVSRQDFTLIGQCERTGRETFYAGFPDFTDAVWLKPDLICVVEYMERTENGGLRQPVFKGIRDDKAIFSVVNHYSK